MESLGLLEGSSLLDEPHTSPENESSVVTWAKRREETLLLTSDAGLCALTKVVEKYAVGKPFSMQLPHHGSRRNLNEFLIERLAPTHALVSATGNRKHPRPAVVNAFKALGTKVYSTHYPRPANLHHSIGTVPARNFVSATPLWDAEAMTKGA